MKNRSKPAKSPSSKMDEDSKTPQDNDVFQEVKTVEDVAGKAKPVVQFDSAKFPTRTIAPGQLPAHLRMDKKNLHAKRFGIVFYLRAAILILTAIAIALISISPSSKISNFDSEYGLDGQIFVLICLLEELMVNSTLQITWTLKRHIGQTGVKPTWKHMTVILDLLGFLVCVLAFCLECYYATGTYYRSASASVGRMVEKEASTRVHVTWIICLVVLLAQSLLHAFIMGLVIKGSPH